MLEENGAFPPPLLLPRWPLRPPPLPPPNRSKRRPSSMSSSRNAGPKKIEVIKVIRQLTNLGLVEAKTMAETAGGKVLSAVGKDAAKMPSQARNRRRRRRSCLTGSFNTEPSKTPRSSGRFYLLENLPEDGS